MDLCLRKAQKARKSRDYLDVTVLEKPRFQNVFRLDENGKPAFLNSSGLKSVFEKHRFHDGLVWTVDLTVEMKLRFQIFPAWCGRTLRQGNRFGSVDH